jgi:hypothetical protein
MVIAVTIVVWFLNIWGSRAMPLIQNIMLAIHVFGFLTIIIVLWALAPRNTANHGVLQPKYSVKMCATVTAGKMLAKPYREP